ncbi:transposase [Streptomyces sp. NPDC018964]|uniref:transposase n=1 Tax=Streptomyces sp. NPDC018964 TaxID=3365058 RepID=UPI0037B3A246
MQFVFQRCPRGRCICDRSHDGRPKRLNTEASFTALCGASLIEYSSGRGSTCRLNHSGDRRANTALHRIVITRLRHDPHTQTYGERRIQEGKTSKRASLLGDGRGSHAAASRSPGPDCVRTAVPFQ